MISLSHVTYTYPGSTSPALQDLSLSVPAGQFLGIVGENGAGKSTLAYAITGFIPHFYQGTLTGELFVDNKATQTTPLSDLVITSGLVFQNPFNQISGTKFTVQEEIAFGLENLGVSREEMLNRTETMMQLVGIKTLATRSPLSLSGGQMQRVVIASVLAMRPKVLVLDEPTSQLDPVGSREVFAAIHSLAVAENITIVMIEHKLEWLAVFADRLIAMAGGKIIADGKPADVLTDEKISATGVGQTRFTEAARKARDIGRWPVGRRLAVTLEDAVAGFKT
jgi:energy-coupling factor transport system ATP-binding protein